MNPTDKFIQYFLWIPDMLRVILKSRNPGELPDCGAELFIIANGPSVREQNISVLKDRPVMVVNQFITSELFQELRPPYYLLQAPEYFDNKAGERFVKNTFTPFMERIGNINWNIEFLVPFYAKGSKLVSRLKENHYVSIRYYNTTPIDTHFRLSRSLKNNGWGMSRPHNVLIPSLYAALWMGCRNIYLLGADHSWLPHIKVADNNKVFLEQKHFYDEGRSTPQTMKNRSYQDRKLHEILHKFYLSFRGYHEIKELADSLNVEIFNLTPGSYIDAFPRKKMAEVI